MKNIVVVGVSQSGLFELSSLIQENVTQEKGYRLLGGYFDVFGDQYTYDSSEKHSKQSLSSFKEGAYRRSFTLNSENQIQEYRDYGLPGMVKFDVRNELQKRISLLKSSEGFYVISLSTWELDQIRKEFPEMESQILNLMTESDTIAVDIDNASEALASYVLAHESGVWVKGKEEASSQVEPVVAKTEVLSQFGHEVKILKDLLRGAPSLRTVTSSEVEDNSKVCQKLFGKDATKAALFTRPKYKNGSLKYIANNNDVENFADSLKA